MQFIKNKRPVRWLFLKILPFPYRCIAADLIKLKKKISHHVHFIWKQLVKWFENIKFFKL